MRSSTATLCVESKHKICGMTVYQPTRLERPAELIIHDEIFSLPLNARIEAGDSLSPVGVLPSNLHVPDWLSTIVLLDLINLSGICIRPAGSFAILDVTVCEDCCISSEERISRGCGMEC